MVSTGPSSVGDDDEEMIGVEKGGGAEVQKAAPSRGAMEAWVASLQTLIKGKVRMVREVSHINSFIENLYQRHRDRT
jgi:hypothetical protein